MSEAVQVEIVDELATGGDVRRAAVAGALASGVVCTVVGVAVGFLLGALATARVLTPLPSGDPS